MAIHLKRLEIMKKRHEPHSGGTTPASRWKWFSAGCEQDNFMSAEEAKEYGLVDKVIYTR